MFNTKPIFNLLVLCAITISCKKEKTRICELYNNEVGYAIGTIQSFTSTGFTISYNYDYFVDGVQYNGEEKAYGIGQKDETLIAKQFFVVYALGDFSNSDLNTSYFIESEQDFDSLKSDFSSQPPPPDFPNKCK